MPSYVASTRRGPRLGGGQGNNRYRQARRPERPKMQWDTIGRWFRLGVYAFVGISFFMAVSLGLLAAYRFMTRSAHFGLDQIEVQGATYMKYEDVLQAAGLSLGQNAFGLNMQKIERELRDLPWVAGVSLKRDLPDRLVVTVEEREPRYWRKQGEELFFADEQGEFIAPLESATFKTLPMLYLEEGGQESMGVLEAFGARARALHSPFDPRQAAWIRLQKAGVVELYFDTRNLKVSLDSRDWEFNLECLRQTWGDLQRRGETGSVRAMSAHGAKVWVTRS